MKYAFIHRYRQAFSVQRMCHVVEVARSDYYAWRQPEILNRVAADLIDASVSAVGRTGLSEESVLRCLVLKQQLGCGYERLAFHLSDSMTYQIFIRLPTYLSLSRSCLQSTIRCITPETLEQTHQVLTRNPIREGVLSMDKLRIDSTVVASHIAPPSDS